LRIVNMRKLYLTIVLSLTLFATVAMATDKTARFTLPSGVKVMIVEAPFQKAAFKIEGCSDKDSMCRINDDLPYGLAFGLPKTYVKSITVSYKGQSYLLDASDMYDAWGKRPLEYPNSIRYFGGQCIDNKNCQFRGLFSDGASSFCAEWVVAGGISKRTVLTGSSDVMDLFMKHIDPPVYE
jgi:hypothetical protein